MPTRGWQVWPPAALLLAGPTVLAFFSGGYGVRAQLLGCAFAFAACGWLALTAPVSASPSRLGLVAAAGLGGFAAWTAASVGWAPVADTAAEETAQCVLYALVFAGALLVMSDPPVRRATPHVLLAGILVVGLYALGGRLLPDVVPTTLSARAGSRLQQPLTYWNALGLLMAFGTLLAATLAADVTRTRALRAAACAAAVPIGIVMYLTFSRGSLVATAAGLLALVLVRPSRAVLVAAALVAVACGVLGGILNLFPAVLNLDLDGSRLSAQGGGFAVIVALVTVGVGLAFARLSGSAAVLAPLSLRGPVRGLLAGAGVVAVLGVGALIVTSSDRTEPLSSSKGRLTTITTNRGTYWTVALDSFASHPAAGVGAGSFAVEWRRERHSPESALDAHSLYLETLAELGLVGALLLVTFLAAAALGALRAARDPSDTLAPAAVACLAAFFVHVGLDWTWEVPAVVLVVLVLAAAALTPPAGARAVTRG